MSLRQNKIGLFVESQALLIVTPNQINLFSRKTYLERSWCLLLNHSVASKWSAILNLNNLVMSHNQVTDPVHSIVSKLILQDSKMATSKQTFLLSVKYWPRQNKIQLKILSHLRKVAWGDYAGGSSRMGTTISKDVACPLNVIYHQMDTFPTIISKAYFLKLL